jgi:alpha-ketoglutarate-dependent taurine dioxygenase
MKNHELVKPRIPQPGSLGRKAVSLSQNDLVRIAPLLPGKHLPWVVRPAMNEINLLAWAEKNREFIKETLTARGALLFRGLNLKSPEEFEQFMGGTFGELLKYTYRSTPRSRVSGNIYTSTEYPADQFIPFHNEMSYSRTWPMKIGFFCVKAAQEGGETPIADSRKVFQGISEKTRARFMEKGVSYVRNYGAGFDLSWQNVFQTEDPHEAEAYCRNAGIEFEWLGVNRLRTREVCQAVTSHPQTSEPVWFNQAHLFHVSSLPPKVAESFLAEFTEKNLPRNAYYGDGSPIGSAELDEIRQAYQQQAIVFPWQEGDVLVLDNVLTAHARTPFVGQRKIVVGMA